MGWVQGYYRNSRPKSSAGALGVLLFGVFLFTAWLCGGGGSTTTTAPPALHPAPRAVAAPTPAEPNFPYAHHHPRHHHRDAGR